METNAANEVRTVRPLALVLEGKSWMLTAVLEATVSLWMVSLAADGYGFFARSIDVGTNWLSELFNYIMYLIIGALSAALAVGALALNFRPLELHNWRWRSCRSIFALIVVDLMALDHLLNTIHKTRIDIPDASTSKVAGLLASAFLSFVGVSCTVFFNFLYVKEFGLCLCCRGQSVGRHYVTQAEEWAKLNEIPIAQVVITSQENNHSIDDSSNLYEANIPENEISQNPFSQDVHASQGAQQLLSIEKQISVSSQAASLKLKRLDTRQLIEIGSLNLSTRQSIDPSTSITPDTIVPEQPSREEPERRRERRRLSFVPDASRTIQKFVLSSQQPVLTNIHFSLKWIRDTWSQLKEEPGRFRYAVWIKSAFFTSVIVLIYALFKSFSIVFSLVSMYKKDRDRIASNMAHLDLCLREIGWSGGAESVSRKTIIRLLLIVDRVIMVYDKAALVGYPLGTLFGLFSLVAVLIQHKRMSLAVSNTLDVLRSQTNGEEQITIQWQALCKKYPVTDACYFLAILSSTAVIQAQIIGAVLSVFLGLLINYAKLQLIVQWVGLYVVAYIIVFIIETFVMKFLRTSLMTPDGFGISHPRWFNFCMVVLSMVNLVIGILYALWRILYLVVTTVFVLNRLDVSLFTAGKSLDNGHNAFMSMLMLTVLIQQDAEQFKKNKRRGMEVESV